MSIYSDSKSYLGESWSAWNRFWFLPTDPATLCFLRLMAGGMLFYTHLVWSLDLQAFLGQQGWLPVEYLRDPLQDGTAEPIRWVWSVFFWLQEPWQLWAVHIVALIVFLCLMLGLFSRTAAFLAFLFAVSYAYRVTPGAFFGLDKVNCMLALYLMVGPCGARYSLDSVRRLRRGNNKPVEPSTWANLSIRLIQMHLCIVYLFTGLAKLEGENWRAGSAVWWAVANPEYQSLDMTWMAHWPILVALATHATVAWELSYCFLIWNRYFRPLVLWMAVFVHLGIAVIMGMITFGLAMLFANISFLAPETVRQWLDPMAERIALRLGGGE